MQMKPNKASGLDLISANFVKCLSDIITTPLCKIINHPIDCGKIPTQLKVAKVSPLYKKGSVNECGNYRPISTLPIFSKVMEKLINQQILARLENNNHLTQNQFGFRHNRSTSDAISNFTNKILESFDKGESVLGIFIDFSKAFDTIDHKTLIYKFKKFNFSSSAIK